MLSMSARSRAVLPFAVAMLAGLALSAGPASALALPSGARARPHPSSRAGKAEARLLGGPLSSGPTNSALAQQLSPVHLSYYGGRVLAHAQLVAVHWGTPDVALRARLDSWYASFVGSTPVYGWLSEYSTVGLSSVFGTAGSNQTLVAATYAGSYVIVPSAATVTSTITGDDIKAQLTNEIGAGRLPAPQGETLYVLHFAPAVTIRDGSGTACRDYCAYHDNIVKAGTNYTFAVIPSHAPGSPCATCGELDWYSNLGGSISHEVIEAVTDPDVGGASGYGWLDTAPGDSISSHSEIGDICADSSLTGVSEIAFGSGDAQWAVQREWSNQYGACIATGEDGMSFEAATTVLYQPGDTFDLPIHVTKPANGAPTTKLSLFGGGAGTGITATLSTSQVASNGTFHLNVATTAQSPTSFRLAVIGETGRANPIAVFLFGTSDFLLSTSKAQALTAGGAPVTISVSSLNLVGAPRALTLLPLSQPGLSASITPAQLKVGDKFDLKLSAAAGTPSGTSTLRVNFSDGKVTHEVAVPLTVSGDDFEVTPPASVSGKAGGEVSFTLTTSVTHGQPQPLTLTLPGLPPGVTASFSPASVQSGQSVTVSLHLTDAVPLGDLRLSLAAAGLFTTTNVEVRVTVLAGGCASAGPAPWLAVLLLPLLRRRRAT